MSESLQHVGILGMHWGRHKSAPSADHVKAQGLKKKKLHEMSNEEIRTLTSRMQLESQYKNLKPKKVAYGKKILGATLGSAGKIAMGAVVTGVGAAAGKKILDQVMKYGPVAMPLAKEFGKAVLG